MRPIVLSCMLMLACEPPPPVDGAAGGGLEMDVQIIIPLANEVIPLDDDCVLRTLVAWDIDGLESVPFKDATNTPGEGHVHVVWAPPAYEATSDQSIELEQAGLTVGSSLTISVDLRENEHASLEVTAETEIEIGPDAGNSCP
ncbi:MAG: hypothetical protein ACI8PZ_005731 [Myxococcota bacterium]|jgi:hypothetical protein